MKHSKS